MMSLPLPYATAHTNKRACKTSTVVIIFLSKNCAGVEIIMNIVCCIKKQNEQKKSYWPTVFLCYALLSVSMKGISCMSGHVRTIAMPGIGMQYANEGPFNDLNLNELPKKGKIML